MLVGCGCVEVFEVFGEGFVVVGEGYGFWLVG